MQALPELSIHITFCERVRRPREDDFRLASSVRLPALMTAMRPARQRGNRNLPTRRRLPGRFD